MRSKLKTPEAIAASYENEQITYKELEKRANQLAHYLQKHGVGPESLVGVYMERSLQMMIALLGILKSERMFHLTLLIQRVDFDIY